jgi:4-hydroxy-3-methylbut-2-enyl diphosphate reductase
MDVITLNIVRARHLGMCFGVRDAIALAFTHGEARPLTILGDLVHNATVSAALQAKGIAVAHDLADVRSHTVMITAHGASARRVETTRAQGLEVVEATCPLVRVAHAAVSALVRDGYHPVIIGQRGHVEVRGLTEDLESFDIVRDEEDVLQLQAHPRIGIAAQTTQSIERVQHLVALIQRRFPQSEVRFVDTVCQPTKQRQQAADDLASQCDVIVVVGGANSNNTRELVATCARYGSRVHHVQTDADLRADWFLDAKRVGITAGTSTPDHVVDRVERGIRELATVWNDGTSLVGERNP